MNGLTEPEWIEVEKQYWQALKDQDSDAAMRMTTDPCIVAGAQGVSAIDRTTFAKMMESPSWRLQDFELDKVQVQRVADDVALIGYEVREDLTVEGAHVTLQAADTSVWVRRDDAWQCALHTESILGDPFGRDRRDGRQT